VEGDAKVRASVSVEDILSLVHCAQDYGHANGVFVDAMAGMLDRKLDDEEILAYAYDFLTEESRAKGYGEEDRNGALETLVEFKKRYIGGECGISVPDDNEPNSEPEPVGPAERLRILAGAWKFVSTESQ
jgi:hypothetical protein